ncbi:hypothetical protein DH2020_021177 [Rehmannia glutinosa]|uniref:DUF674 domain-containing protein n=1 Tax=Rehmannia glutinosa TaxID=99300 RepID=A0ABR0WDH9_REHGL
MADSNTTDSTVSMKLLIDTKGEKVLFAEAGKDFVDFLIHIFSLPIGTVINLLRNQETCGSLANLHQSIENLNESYIQPNQTKNTLLKPVSPVTGSSVPLLAIKGAPTEKKLYMCRQCSYNGNYYGTDDPRAICPGCRANVCANMHYVASPAARQASGDGGIVKGVVTYMVMDDLVVMPLSTISSITMLRKFNVKDLNALEEKVVKFGKDEAVKLLSASLQSKKVLTDVFLKGVK